MRMLEIDLPVPDHTTLSRRACGLPVPERARIGTGDLQLIVDSTGLKLRGAGEWLFEKHGTAKRRAWRKLHIGLDGNSGEIGAFDLTDKDVDVASHVEPLLEQLVEAPRSLWPMAPMIGAESRRRSRQKPERQFHRSSMQGGRAWTNCRNIADPARPACPLGRRAWAHELAEGLRL